MTDGTAAFDQAVGVLWEAATSGSSAEAPIDRNLTDTVLSGLRRYLLTVFGRTELVDDEDVIADVIEAFWRASSEGRVPKTAATAYLLRSVRNAWISEWRKRVRRREYDFRPTSPVAHEAADEAALRSLGAGMDSLRVRAGMEALVARGRHTTVKVVASWLDEAWRTGSTPSLRQVADRVGLSHTSVRRALEEFAENVP